MSKVGIGIIGSGARVRGIIKGVLNKSTDIEVNALFDTSVDSIRISKESLNCENASVCNSFEELVQREDVQWVVIGSWNCFHKEHAIAAFNAGKHVFCEKPLATNLDDCIAVREAWEKSGKILSMGFTLRYSPHYRKIKELISAGEIGDIISMEFNGTLEFNHGGFIAADWRRLRKNAGTHLLEKCCHDIDLVNWMVESKAVKAASFGNCNFFKPENAYHKNRIGKNQEGLEAYNTWPRPDKDVDPFTGEKDIFDNQVAIIEYENEVRATFHTNINSAIPERRMYINGTEGAIRADVLAGKIELKRIGFDTRLQIIDANVSGGHGGGDDYLQNSLIESMLHNAAPKTSLEDGFNAAITVFGIDLAADTNQIVDLRPMWEKAGL